jgi:hypothetical protein
MMRAVGTQKQAENRTDHARPCSGMDEDQKRRERERERERERGGERERKEKVKDFLVTPSSGLKRVTCSAEQE